MPPRKRDKVLAAVPDANDVITYLREQDHPQWAESVQTVVDYATEAVAAKDRQTELDKKADKNRSINLGKPFHTHVIAAAEKTNTNLSEFVRDKLTQFIEGEWTPEQPPRAPYGEAPEKAWLTVRVASDLWSRAGQFAKDPAAVEERGYKLSLSQVVIAALHKEFPMPEKKTTTRR